MSEQVLILLDVGASMHDMSKNEKIRMLDIAVDSINILIQQKILYNPNHEVGLMLMGMKKISNNNIFFIQECVKPNFQLMRDIQTIKDTEKQEDILGGDIFEGIYQCISALNKIKKKSQQKLFIISNGKGDTYHGIEHVGSLVKNIVDLDIKVNFIGLDFDLLQQQPEQQKNANLLNYFLQTAGPSFARFFSITQTMQIFSQLRCKNVLVRCKLRTNLEITSQFQIQVNIYTKTMESKLQSLKKYSTVVDYEKDSKSGAIKTSKQYFEADDPNMTPVNDEFLIKGFNYGKQIIPVSKIIHEEMKLSGEKCLKILGFAKSSEVPRQNYMSGVDLVVPPKDVGQQNYTAFNTMVYAMFQLQKVGIVRYVTRANAAPKLAALIPHIGFQTQSDLKYTSFYLVTLPTIEDIRYFQFNSLKIPTVQQEQAASQLIDSMDLDKMNDDIVLKPKDTFNPIIQNFNQSVIFRALNDDVQNLPELNPQVNQYLHPETKIYEKCKQAIQNFGNSFDFKSKEKPQNKQKVLWRNIIEQQTKDLHEAFSMEQQEQNYISKKFNFEDKNDEIVRKISELNALKDFKAMITEPREDLVESAMNQLEKIINQFIQGSLNDIYFEKAIQLLQEYRIGAISEDECPRFNSFLINLKQSNHYNFWKKIQQCGITLIMKSENQQSNITIEEATNFIVEELKIQNNIYTNQQKQNDLFEEIE